MFHALSGILFFIRYTGFFHLSQMWKLYIFFAEFPAFPLLFFFFFKCTNGGKKKSSGNKCSLKPLSTRTKTEPLTFPPGHTSHSTDPSWWRRSGSLSSGGRPGPEPWWSAFRHDRLLLWRSRYRGQYTGASGWKRTHFDQEEKTNITPVALEPIIQKTLLRISWFSSDSPHLGCFFSLWGRFDITCAGPWFLIARGSVYVGNILALLVFR